MQKVLTSILTGWEGNTRKYETEDSNTSATEGLIFPVLPDRTVNIEVITRF